MPGHCRRRPRPSRRWVAALLAPAVVLVAAPACAGSGDDLSGRPTVSATPLPDPEADITNGVQARPAEAVLDQALSHLLAAGSYRVTGSPAAGEPLDLRFSSGSTLGRPGEGTAEDPTGAVGRGVTGTLTADGSTFQILAVDGQVYVRGDLTWLASSVAPEALTTVGEKWLQLPVSAVEPLAPFLDPELFARSLLQPEGPVQPVGASRISAQPAWGVRATESGALLWVSGTGPVLPLQVEREGATAEAGTLTISEVGTPVPLLPPAADQVVVVPDSAVTSPG